MIQPENPNVDSTSMANREAWMVVDFMVCEFIMFWATVLRSPVLGLCKEAKGKMQGAILFREAWNFRKQSD